jgi:hypothetical protein
MSPVPPTPPTETQKPPKRWLGLVAWYALLLATLAVYLAFAGALIERTNPDPSQQGQRQQMERALAAREQLDSLGKQSINQAMNGWWPHVTDGIVAPLWPWVAARVAPAAGSGMSEEETRTFFRRGKWLNVAGSATALLLLGLYLRRQLHWSAAWLCVLLVGWGAFLPRSVYFQPEPLSYVWFLVAWLLAIQLTKCNTLWLQASFGLACGLAYISQASTALLLGAFFFGGTYRWLTGWLRCGKMTRWCGRQQFIGWFLVGLCFLAVAGPTMVYKAQRFGSPWHHYEYSWMWLEDFPQNGSVWTQQHQTAAQLEQAPGPASYLQAHPAPQWVYRLADGTQEVVGQFLAPAAEFTKPQAGWRRLLDLRGVYLLWLAAAVGMLGGLSLWRQRKSLEIRPLLACDAGLPVLLSTGLFVAYALLYGWYAEVEKGERYLLMLYGPLVVSMIWGLERLQGWFGKELRWKWVRWATWGVYSVVLFALIVRVGRLWLDRSSAVWFDPGVL